MQQIIHATAIEYQGLGILLLGPSGAGKSDLALRMIGHKAALIADDQVVIEDNDHCILLSAPLRVQGLLEVRGVGIIKMPFSSNCQLSVAIELRSCSEIKRMPQHQHKMIGKYHIPLYSIDPNHPSAVNRMQLIAQLQQGDCHIIQENCLL